jgi:soluble lytic murein transglycosylase
MKGEFGKLFFFIFPNQAKIQPMKRLVIFWLLFLFCCTFAFAQKISNETHQKIKTAVENRDYQAAVNELKALEISDKKSFELNNYDYLLARMQEKNGDLAAAMANYQAVSNRNSILMEYALWHLSQIARSSGNLILERIYLQQIFVFAPDSLLKDAVHARFARSFFESKNYDSAISSLLVVRGSLQKTVNNEQRTTNNELSRENQLLLGRAFLQSGKIKEAREVFTKLADNLSNPAQPDDFALAAARVLDELDGGSENFGKTAPKLTENDHMKRAAIYYFNRDFPLARMHFQAIVERFPESSNVAYALYQTGRTHAQEGNYALAIEWFERVQAQFPDDLIARDALSQTASAYARLNKSTEAVSRYKKFIEKYADADNIERAYLNIIDVLRDAGEDGEALKWTVKTREVFKGKLPEALALFAQARIHITQNDWQNALNDLNNLLAFPDLGGTRLPGGTNKPEVLFLKGFVLEQMQKYAEAIDVYLSIPDGRNEYYGGRATERLRALGADEKAKPFVEEANRARLKDLLSSIPETRKLALENILRLTRDEELRKANLEGVKRTYAALSTYQRIPAFKILELGRKEVIKERRTSINQNHHRNLADELLFLGLYDEAAPELEAAILSVPTALADGSNPKIKSDEAYTLAVFYKRGDMAHRAVGFLEPFWKTVPADYQIELIPREQIEMLYPAPYADSLLKYSAERNLDPRFVLAIMRQESRYRADVKSYAAARGLMQFISATSDKIAAELGKTNFKQDQLYDPPTAILFGSQYLSNLFRQFPAEEQAVAASYNAGEDNIARWLMRSKSSDADRYVPEIVFSQSKDYVYKVMANYRVYQVIYDEKLRAR